MKLLKKQNLLLILASFTASSSLTISFALKLVNYLDEYNVLIGF